MLYNAAGTARLWVWLALYARMIINQSELSDNNNQFPIQNGTRRELWLMLC